MHYAVYCDKSYGFLYVVNAVSYSPTALPAKTTLSAKTTTAAPGPYWLPWGSWQCTFNNGVCFSARFRNCSTGSDDDCVNTVGGNEFSIEACTSKTCLGNNHIQISFSSISGHTLVNDRLTCI